MTSAGASRQGECARSNERPGAANDRIVHAFMLQQQTLRVTVCSRASLQAAGRDTQEVATQAR